MLVQYPHLHMILRYNFHQDWLDDADSADEVVEQIVVHYDANVKSAIVDEINEILIQADENEISVIVREYGCYYEPWTDSMAYGAWLQRLKYRLINALSEVSDVCS